MSQEPAQEIRLLSYWDPRECQVHLGRHRKDGCVISVESASR